ncbi:hypothetical protein IW140_002416 [Coemansia sp. RSA 1813]|nr:hypothetical protein EV178_000917 [Coemansia sp. RSA 1646]KAJ1773020.1 hypothetical protein LPJ74_000971 [Coemansia sp. RSA 1843]KAJ2092204.1 hypothetical protein IW138_001271 [Coemansia sp. RSA 986]KAJ2215340.1 hypothetical protein EV179_002288 [Coemansia sp. RSA 487]KAJ2570323.1 hypothetical protein IW140_002416 [Coemansia sp. RSA 1813]
MLAYQHQQPSPVAAPARKSAEPNSVAAVPPASATAANSALRFGNTGIASWTIDNNIEKPEAVGSQNRAFPKSFGAVGNPYRMHVPFAGNNDPQPLARSQHNSRGSHRNNPDPLFSGKCWQNYHKQYNQQQQMRQQQGRLNHHDAPVANPAAGSDGKGTSIRRVPNARDMNKQWRAQTNYSGTTMGAASAASKASNAREASTLLSSTYQENDASLLSGISLALNKSKHHQQQIHNDASTGATKVNTPPLFDIAQSRTPYAMSPAESMKTPGYVDPDSLPFELGSDITDNTTGKQYKLLSVLGEGSYAVVYLARCSHDGAKYALKCLSKLGLSARQLSLQRTELEIHASVCPHPHIVTLYSHFETRDWLFLVMERVAGPDLYDYITQHPAFNANQEERRFIEATRMFKQMIDAVAHIHALKAYHRDLKPENFILGADGNLKLTDFGLATRESLSTDFECGSKPYMSYENRNGGLNPNDPTVYGPRDDYSPRLSDVWALGVLFLNLLFAQSPWTDPSRESCFKYCRFLREGAGFLVGQFPKLPREVADFLVTRVFSPESGRCNVLELKQWVHDLEYPFKMPKIVASAMTAPRPIANRHNNTKVGGINGAPRRVNNASPTTATTTVTTAAGTFGKSYNTTTNTNVASSSASKKWWLPSSGAFGTLPKLHQSPQPAEASTALATDPASATSPDSVNLKSSSHAKKHAYSTQQIKHMQPQMSSNLSTSVPAQVFSQIIPATQAAAARKMMPREVNPTAAKAAAAILQSSMMGLPKNGLGQGKEDNSTGADHSRSNSDNDDNSSSAEKHHQSSVSMSWADQLEDLSEEDEFAIASDDGLAGVLEYGAAAADVASKFPKQNVGVASLGFSMPKQHGAGSSDIATSYIAEEFSASSQDSDKTGEFSSLTAASRLRSVASAAATVTSAIDASSFSDGCVDDDDDNFGVLGHFSDASNNEYDIDSHANVENANMASFRQLPRHGHDVSKINVHSASRVRFTDTTPQVLSPMSQDDRSGAYTPTTAAMASNSSNSSLTATLVTSSIEYYSPHIKSFASGAPTNGGDRTAADTRRKSHGRYGGGYEIDADADDENDGNWRQRKTGSGGGAAGSISKVASSAAKKAAVFQRQQAQQSPIRNNNNAAVHDSQHYQSQQRPIAMHSMPAPFKHIGAGSKIHRLANNNNSNNRNSAAADMAAFSWADDVEELPIPSLTSKIECMSMDYVVDKQQCRNDGARKPEESLDQTDEDALSDDFSWSADDDSAPQSGYMFFPMDM